LSIFIRVKNNSGNLHYSVVELRTQLYKLLNCRTKWRPMWCSIILDRRLMMQNWWDG